MILRLSHRLALTLLCTALGAGIAHAQSPAQSAGGTGGSLDRLGPVVGGKPGKAGPAAKLAPPPALPGAVLGQDRVTPSEKAAVELTPNDSLFDAVNRGDIVSARDALNRGEDPQARNVLGLTALDESIDLGRNDITFLLLSLRPSGAEPPAPTKAPAKPVAAAQVKPTPKPAPVSAPAPAASRQQAQGQQAQGQQAHGQQAQAVKPIPGSAPAGTPNPQAGFLGFGG